MVGLGKLRMSSKNPRASEAGEEPSPFDEDEKRCRVRSQERNKIGGIREEIRRIIDER